MSNPNLLDNPDFRINQRGQSEYYNVAYSVDRWFMPTNGLRMTVNDSQITVGRTDNRSGKILIQRISKSELNLSGKIITFSTMVSGVNADYSIRIWADDNTIGVTYAVNDGVYTCTAQIPDDYEMLSVGYHTNSTTPGMIIPYWAKLELGGKATPFVPPNPAVELMKCQRYYQRIGGTVYYCIGSGVITHSGTVMVLCPLSAAMRNTNKTVNINGTVRIVTKGHIGETALTCTGTASGATVAQNAVILPLSMDAVDDSLVGCGIIAQCRDNETYVEISADL